MAETDKVAEEQVIPIVEEQIAVSKREIETGTVRVALTTDAERLIARETLHGRRVEVDRVSVNRELPEGEAAPEIRQEEDTLIIPLVEEVAVVTRRLVIRDELRLRFIPTEEPFAKELMVRRQRATVEHVPERSEKNLKR
jgi:stress response protein YsnF